MKPLFFIWTPRDWAAFCSGFLYHMPMATRNVSVARQEFGHGCIITMLNGGLHQVIRPVTVH